MRTTWDETWLAVARVVAERSACSRAKLGAVIVDANNRIVATGYNGPPANYLALELKTGLEIDIENCQDFCPRGRYGPRADAITSYADCFSVHAELNCLGFCDRSSREGGTLYVTGVLCLTCAKAIGNSGLARVVIAADDQDRTYRDPARSDELLRACGLMVDYA